MADLRAYISGLEGIVLGQLILHGKVVALRVRSLVIELNPAECQAARTNRRGSEGSPDIPSSRVPVVPLGYMTGVTVDMPPFDESVRPISYWNG